MSSENTSTDTEAPPPMKAQRTEDSASAATSATKTSASPSKEAMATSATESHRTPQEIATPFQCTATTDTNALVSFAVPHSVVSQVLTTMIAVHIPPRDIKVPTLADAQRCVSTFQIRSSDEVGLQAALEFAARLPLLTALHASDEGMDAASVGAIVEKLPRLVVLDIGFNDNIDAAAIEHVSKLQHLEKLELTCCFEIDENALTFLSALPCLKHLLVDECFRVGTAALTCIGKISTLETLNVALGPVIGKDGLDQIGRMGNLVTLNLNNALDDAEPSTDLAVLRNLPRLESLSLSLCNDVDEAVIGHIKALPQLTDLDLSSCLFRSNSCFSALGTLHTLKILSLAGSGDMIHAKNLAELTRLVRLESLDVGYCPAINAEALTEIAKLGRLKTLEMEACPHVDAAAIACISSMRSLERLWMLRCPLVDDPALGHLVKSPHLRRLCDLTITAHDGTVSEETIAQLQARFGHVQVA